MATSCYFPIDTSRRLRSPSARPTGCVSTLRGLRTAARSRRQRLRCGGRPLAAGAPALAELAVEVGWHVERCTHMHTHARMCERVPAKLTPMNTRNVPRKWMAWFVVEDLSSLCQGVQFWSHVSVRLGSFGSSGALSHLYSLQCRDGVEWLPMNMASLERLTGNDTAISPLSRSRHQGVGCGSPPGRSIAKI